MERFKEAGLFFTSFDLFKTCYSKRIMSYHVKIFVVSSLILWITFLRLEVAFILTRQM